MKVLVTAFDPFAGEKVNPALQAVQRLPDTIEGHVIDKLEIPTVFYQSIEVVREKLAETEYDIVLAIGQAGGRYEITPERVAINVDVMHVFRIMMDNNRLISAFNKMGRQRISRHYL